MIFEDDDILGCPACGDESTHVDEVSAYSAGGQYVVITASGEDEFARLGSEASFHDEHVGRRHEFRLQLYCEGCRCTTEITLRQHKGATLVSLRDDGLVRR